MNNNELPPIVSSVSGQHSAQPISDISPKTISETEAYLQKLSNSSEAIAEQSKKMVRMAQIISNLSLINEKSNLNPQTKSTAFDLKKQLSKLSEGTIQTEPQDWKNTIATAIQTAKNLNAQLQSEKQQLIGRINRAQNMLSVEQMAQNINEQIQLLDNKDAEDVIDALVNKVSEFVCPDDKIAMCKASIDPLVPLIDLNMTKVMRVLSFFGPRFEKMLNDKIPELYKKAVLHAANQFIYKKYGLNSGLSFAKQHAKIEEVEKTVKASGNAFKVTWTEKDSIQKPSYILVCKGSRENVREKVPVTILPGQTVLQLKVRLLINRSGIEDKDVGLLLAKKMGIVIEREKGRPTALKDDDIIDADLIKVISEYYENTIQDKDAGDKQQNEQLDNAYHHYPLRFADIQKIKIHPETMAETLIDDLDPFSKNMKEKYFNQFNYNDVDNLVTLIIEVNSDIDQHNIPPRTDRQPYQFPSINEIYDRMLITLIHNKYDETFEANTTLLAKGDEIAKHYVKIHDLLDKGAMEITPEERLKAQIAKLQEKLFELECLEETEEENEKLSEEVSALLSPKNKDNEQELLKNLKTKLKTYNLTDEEIDMELQKAEVIEISDRLGEKVASIENSLLNKDDINRIKESALELHNQYKKWAEVANRLSPNNTDYVTLIMTELQKKLEESQNQISSEMLQFLKTPQGQQTLRELAKDTTVNQFPILPMSPEDYIFRV